MNFKATVQYNDFVGSVAADRADKHDFNDFLKTNKLLEEDEFLLAIELYHGETPISGRDPFISVAALVSKGASYDDVQAAITAEGGPIPVERREVKMTPEQFFSTFKRFAITLVRRGLDLEGREYKEI